MMNAIFDFFVWTDGIRVRDMSKKTNKHKQINMNE